MSFWPLNLVRELAERNAVVLLGAGASADARGTADATPPLWKALLEEALVELAPHHDSREYARERLEKGQYLEAAEVIFSNCSPADYAEFLTRKFRTPKFAPTEIHELVRDLDTRIVATTNYDRLFEVATGDHYLVRKHDDDDVLSAIRGPDPVLLKAHGCISHPEKTVLTRTSYHEARKNFRFFYDVLDSLFMLHTVLFIGAALTDPDIQLILENVNLSAPCGYPHYALMPAGGNPAWLEAVARAYNIRTLEYSYVAGSNDHSDCVTKLRELFQDVESYRSSHAVA